MVASLDIAIVGAGLMGRWHARYAARAGARVAAVIDPELGRARSLATRFHGARAFPTVGECLRETRVAAVHVCSPTVAHREAIEAALRAGTHALVEKPLAASAEMARDLLDRARAAGVTLSAVHQFPFQRGARRLERQRSRLGGLVRFDFALCSAGGDAMSDEERRDALVTMLPHPISLARRFLSAPVDPSRWRVDAFDSDALVLSARSEKAVASIFLSLAGRPPRCGLTLTGERASGHVDLFHGFSWIESRPASRTGKALGPFLHGAGLVGAASANAARRALAREPAYPGLLPLIRAFYRAIESGGDPPVSAEEVLDAARLADRFLERRS